MSWPTRRHVVFNDKTCLVRQEDMSCPTRRHVVFNKKTCLVQQEDMPTQPVLKLCRYEPYISIYIYIYIYTFGFYILGSRGELDFIFLWSREELDLYIGVWGQVGFYILGSRDNMDICFY